MRVIVQFSIVVIAMFIFIDDRCGLAFTWDILTAAMYKGNYIAVRYFGYARY
jgi:hypothetical protein